MEVVRTYDVVGGPKGLLALAPERRLGPTHEVQVINHPSPASLARHGPLRVHPTGKNSADGPADPCRPAIPRPSSPHRVFPDPLPPSRDGLRTSLQRGSRRHGLCGGALVRGLPSVSRPRRAAGRPGHHDERRQQARALLPGQGESRHCRSGADLRGGLPVPDFARPGQARHLHHDGRGQPAYRSVAPMVRDGHRQRDSPVDIALST